VPVLLMPGVRVFDNLGEGVLKLEGIRVIETPSATHLRFAVPV
jgi:hypothetical protein